MLLLEMKQKVRFILILGKLLHTYGASSFRLEEAMEKVTGLLGMKGDFFTTPTAIMASFRTEKREVSRLARIEPSGNVDLGKLGSVDTVADEVISQKITVDQGILELEKIVERKPRFSYLVTIVAFGMASGGVSTLLGKNWTDIAAATFLGLGIGLLIQISSRFPKGRDLFDILGAFFVTLVAFLISRFIAPDLSVPAVVISGLVIVMPGLNFTIALSELASGHLMSGSARTFGVATTLFKMMLGVALATKISHNTFVMTTTAVTDLPKWLEYPAILIVACHLSIIFKGERRDDWAIICGALIGHFANKLGFILLGAQLGSFMSGLLVGIFGNLYARKLGRPATIAILPGIILVVPGMMGFRGLSFFLNSEVITGMNMAFNMFLIAISLVGGLLVANLFLPPKRIL
jgi:uncharacterized membrane protein YjjP (DUF1212 family)